METTFKLISMTSFFLGPPSNPGYGRIVHPSVPSSAQKMSRFSPGTNNTLNYPQSGIILEMKYKNNNLCMELTCTRVCRSHCPAV